MGNYTELAVDLNLSDDERDIFATLLGVLGTANPSFIAGGCVRDAILRVPRNDIDVFVTPPSHTNVPRLVKDITYRLQRYSLQRGYLCYITGNENVYENSSIITVIKAKLRVRAGVCNIDIILCKDGIMEVVDKFDLNVNQVFTPLNNTSIALASDAFIQALQDNVIRCTPEFIKVLTEDRDRIESCSNKATRLKNKFNKTTGIPKNICCKITPQQLRKLQGEAKWKVDLGISDGGIRRRTIDIGSDNEWVIHTPAVDGQSMRVDRAAPLDTFTQLHRGGIPVAW